MLGIINNVLILLLISLSFPIGYVIGTYSESEIEKTAEKIKIDRFFNIFLVLLEAALITALYFLNSDFYPLTASIIIVVNLCLGSFYTSIKADFVKVVGYQVVFLVVTLLSSLILIL